MEKALIMNLYHRSITFFNILLVLILTTTNVSAQMNSDQTPCPSTLLDAVLRGDYYVAELLLLNYGADPDASLENCQDFEELNEFPANSSLLHITARLSNHPDSYTPSGFFMIDWRRTMYHLLVSNGADENAVDASEKTPQRIFNLERQKLYMSYSIPEGYPTH